ncbi:hypothetical protein T484DRAFT_1959062 [Baffinella frigidus]|nr:hypothetical protein T484DRAFT_1959062 [Cryptophyta sp. CCMP2293]
MQTEATPYTLHPTLGAGSPSVEPRDPAPHHRVDGLDSVRGTPRGAVLRASSCQCVSVSVSVCQCQCMSG